MTVRDTQAAEIDARWPEAPPGREVVLHTRVVTETGGGPDKTILLSAAHMADTPYWLAAAYMHPPDDPGFESVRRRAAEVGCPLLDLPDRGPLDRSVLRSLLAACRHYRVRIWHGHDYKSNMLGLALRPFWPMKLVSTVHGWVKHTARTPLYYAVDRWCLPYYHHVICVSDDLCQRVRGLGVPDARLSLLHNAIDHRQYRRRAAAADADLRRSQGVPTRRLVVGAVGRLSAEKAFHHLIHAVDRLLREGLDLELWIAGEGDRRADLQRLITHLGLDGRVKLLGFVADTVALYEALDLFVLSSLREGLPNVVLEAMAMEVPVAATAVAGVPLVVRDARTGRLCPPGEIDQLASACRDLLGDEGLRRRCVAEARALIESSYSFDARMRQERAIYDRVLGADQDAAAAGPRAATGGP